tara:strand:+ start:17909 stop:20278 length:2370 start_codon:yes stop_codon:yes gene_type:complete
MANKYSRYELRPFQSMYVDNKQPQIAMLLSQRYDQNKQSKDLIDRTLSQMQLLDGDKVHGERVKGEVKNMLKKHIDRGDWENSTLVMQDATNLVSTDAGLLAANESFKVRQAEIQAIREAKLNGIPMIDFGSEMRKTHESYFYDGETDTYITNIYEPMAEKMLDYRTRKERMIGKIPADQRGNWMGIGRGKTNKIANMMVEQYISDTHEGAQEFRKLVEIDLPQTLPIEERTRLAKNAILEDFKEVAQQQEFNKVTGTASGGGGGGGALGLKNGLAFLSSESTQVSTRFDQFDDKVKGLNAENLALVKQLENSDLTQEDRDKISNNIKNNNEIIKMQLKKAADENGVEGKRAYDKFLKLEGRFDEFGEDGQKLFALTQYLTYGNSGGDTDWGRLLTNTAIGAGTGAVAGAPFAVVGAVPGAIGVGGTTFLVDALEQLSEFRNVRDFMRRQEPLLHKALGDSERDQLAEELWGDEDLGDMSVNKINKRLGTNFNQKDIEELYKMTNAYYTFMTKKGNEKKGNQRLSGDEMFQIFAEEDLIATQPLIGFDSSKEGKEMRNNTSSFVKNNLKLLSSGLTSDGMLNEGAINDWIEEGEGNLIFQGVKPGDLMRNIPMKLSFGFDGDNSGGSTRDFYVTDPTVIQPGGWVADMLGNELGLNTTIFDENVRQRFDAEGYDNVTVADYTNALAAKQVAFAGGTQEDIAAMDMLMQDQIILDVLLNPSVNLQNFPFNSNGQRTVYSGTTNQQIPFQKADGSFNEAAWIALKAQPDKLAGLRKTILEMSLNKAANLDF